MLSMGLAEFEPVIDNAVPTPYKAPVLPDVGALGVAGYEHYAVVADGRNQPVMGTAYIYICTHHTSSHHMTTYHIASHFT